MSNQFCNIDWWKVLTDFDNGLVPNSMKVALLTNDDALKENELTRLIYYETPKMI